MSLVFVNVCTEPEYPTVPSPSDEPLTDAIHNAAGLIVTLQSYIIDVSGVSLFTTVMTELQSTSHLSSVDISLTP